MFEMIHGHATGKRTPEYRAWHDMKQRCTNPRHPQWHNYGARGIRVCRRWTDSFKSFLLDMRERPSSQHSLDRRNNDRGYSKSNCRWANKQTQDRNRRTCRLLEWRGKRRPLIEWADELNISRHLLRRRIKRGLSVGDVWADLPRIRGLR